MTKGASVKTRIYPALIILGMGAVAFIFASCSLAGILQGDWLLGSLVFLPSFIILSVLAYAFRSIMDGDTHVEKSIHYDNDDKMSLTSTQPLQGLGKDVVRGRLRLK